ncbi:MAG: hypothetical protein K2O63_05590 [Alistipes sp.]|nr:hypothetical protein [Alistipes sp.]
MKKFLLFFLLFSCMLLSTTKTFAQSADSLKVIVDSLSVKVATLEHDLAYLEIKININSLGADMEILSINVHRISTDFRVATLSKNKKEIVLLRKYHKSCEETLKIIKERIDFLQEIANSNKYLDLENYLDVSIRNMLFRYYNLKDTMSLVGELLN